MVIQSDYSDTVTYISNRVGGLSKKIEFLEKRVEKLENAESLERKKIVSEISDDHFLRNVCQVVLAQGMDVDIDDIKEMIADRIKGGGK